MNTIPPEASFLSRLLILPWLSSPDAQAVVCYNGSKRREWINCGDKIASFCTMRPSSIVGEIWFDITRQGKIADITSPVSGILLQIPERNCYPHVSGNDLNMAGDHRVSILLPEGEEPLLNAREWFNDCMKLKNKVARWSQKLKSTQLDQWPNKEYEYADVESSLNYITTLEQIRKEWADSPQDLNKLPTLSAEAYLRIASGYESEGGNYPERGYYEVAKEWYNKALSSDPTNTKAREGITRTARKQ